MSSYEFFLALRLSDQAPFDEMLGEVAAGVFGRVGCGERGSREVLAWLHGALAEGVTRGRQECEVQFVVRGGDLRVVVLFDGGEARHTTYPIE